MAPSGPAGSNFGAPVVRALVQPVAESPFRPRVVPNLMTVEQVAKRLGVNRATVYKLCDRGELEHLRVLNLIRIEVAHVEAFITKQRRR